jgi:Asp/Glu/hydantoin racemase
MTFTGIVSNGVIVLDQPGALPEGTRVRVIATTEEKKPTLANLLKYAGILQDMPSDFAEQHDHYIHRTPKREEV